MHDGRKGTKNQSGNLTQPSPRKLGGGGLVNCQRGEPRCGETVDLVARLEWAEWPDQPTSVPAHRDLSRWPVRHWLCVYVF